MAVPDPPLPALFSREQARLTGLSDRQIDRRLASGAWRQQRRGWLRPSAGAGSEREEFLAALSAAAASFRTREVVVSHLTAAQVWGFARPLTGWSPPTFTATGGATRYQADRRLQVAALPDRHVVPAAKVLVTTPARTLADCLRVLQPRDGLAMLDAALHAKRITRSELAEVVEYQAGWRGVPTAREVLCLADGRRESAFESWSAWSFDRLKVPTPRWQVGVLDADGRFLGRVDGWWVEGVVGEADGRSKYRLRAAERGAVDAEGLAQVLHQERERELALRASGADVQRWSPSDVLNPRKAEALAGRLRAAIDFAARHPRFCGRTR